MATRAELSEEQWESHLSEWKASGTSQTEYCERNGLTRWSFSYWKRKLNGTPERKLVELTRRSSIPGPEPSVPVVEFKLTENLEFTLRVRADALRGLFS